MNPLLTTPQENFRAGTDGLEFFYKRLSKMGNGAIIFCKSGEADIMLDLERYHIVPNTNIILLPNTFFSLEWASSDFEVRYLACSHELFKAACFRLEPSFIRFLKTKPCCTHTLKAPLHTIEGVLEASHAIYLDTANCFRETILQNLLQIFFLNMYDKVQRIFPPSEMDNSSRRDELFKRFIQLVHTHCTTQRDVAFYAQQLCISPRYLSSITQQQTGKASAKEIIDNFLMLELKAAIQSTNLSLKEIAEKYRFPDQSFFGRYFKKHTGMSPKEFRAKKG